MPNNATAPTPPPSSILVVTSRLKPGGVVRSVCEIVEELARRGPAITLLTPRTPAIEQHATKLNAIGVTLRLTQGKVSTFDAYRAARELRPELAIIQSQALPPDTRWSIAFLALRIPTIETIRSFSLSGRVGPTRPLFYRLRGHRRYRIVALHDSMAQAIHDRFPALRQARRTRRACLNVTPPPPKDPRPGTIICVSRLNETWKDITTLIHAIHILQQRGTTFRARIIGDGPDRDRLQALAERLHLQPPALTFDGWRDNVMEELADAQLCVIASKSEGFGRVAVEAMAAGTPIVASDVPGLRDTLQHDRTALLVPLAHPEAMADAIGRLLADNDLRARLADAGRQEARLYNVPKHVDALLALADEIR